MRPVSAYALAAVCCLLTLPTIEPASAAPHARSRGHVAHSPTLIGHAMPRRGAFHRIARRHGRFHGLAGSGWPGYLDWGGASLTPTLLDGPDRARVDIAAMPSLVDLPVLVGIREAPAAEPAVLVVGHNRARPRSSAKPRGGPMADYRGGLPDGAPGPLIIELAPVRRR